MQAHDVLQAIEGLAEFDFRMLEPFNQGHVGVFRASGGTSPWERHPDCEELLQPMQQRPV